MGGIISIDSNSQVILSVHLNINSFVYYKDFNNKIQHGGGGG